MLTPWEHAKMLCYKVFRLKLRRRKDSRLYHLQIQLRNVLTCCVIYRLWNVTSLCLCGEEGRERNWSESECQLIVLKREDEIGWRKGEERDRERERIENRQI